MSEAFKFGSFIPNFSGIARNQKIDPLEFYKDFEGRITGLGAVILNGYSWKWLPGNVTIAVPDERLDGFYTGYEKFIYLENYDRETGYDCCVASPERLICDYLMYPKKLHFSADYWDLLEGYIEDEDTPDNFDKVYEMLDFFHIEREKFDDTVRRLEQFTELC